MSGPECPVSKELCAAKMEPIEKSMEGIRDDIGHLRADYHDISGKIEEALSLKGKVDEHEKFINMVKKYAVVTLVVIILLLGGVGLREIIAVAK